MKPLAELLVKILNDESTLPILKRGVELRESGEDARFRVTWTVKNGVAHYCLSIRHADGSIES